MSRCGSKSLIHRLVLVAAILFFGCAGISSAQTGKPDLSKPIAIDPDIPQPDIPFIQGANNLGAFLVGGGIGVAIQQTEAGKVFREYMQRNNIDVSKIVFEAFKRTLLEDKNLTLADNSDTKLKLVINTYGFGHAGIFAGNDRRPLLNITASLVNGTNVIWSKRDYLTNLSKLTDVYTFDQLAENPQLTVKSLEQISAILSRQILADLKQ